MTANATERIPREKDPAALRRMMNAGACRLESVDDAWHVLATLWSAATWRGRQIVKQQFDLARYFYLLAERRPEIVVETGLQAGGSALFFMDCLEMLGMPDTPFVGVDLDCNALDASVLDYPHPIAIVKRDCLAPATVATVAEWVGAKRSLIVLDSVHSRAHVAEELRLYAPLCNAGSSLVVEDTDHGGRPILAEYGPSAAEAVEEFMAPGNLGPSLGFDYDREMEHRFGRFTVSPSGWLVRR